MPKTVKLYTTQYCPFCNQAKNILSQKGIAFEQIDLTDDDAKREELQKKTGWMTVPMIFIGDEFIGGAQELSALNASGELDKKISNSN